MPKGGLRPFFASNARTQLAHPELGAHATCTCTHLHFMVVALRTRTFSTNRILWILGHLGSFAKVLSILFWIYISWKFHIVSASYVMKIWIVSSLGAKTIHIVSASYVMKIWIVSSLGAETIQGWKLFKGGNYMRKYGKWKTTTFQILRSMSRAQLTLKKIINTKMRKMKFWP